MWHHHPRKAIADFRGTAQMDLLLGEMHLNLILLEAGPRTYRAVLGGVE